MYIVYVIHSQFDKKFYTGFTSDVTKRLEEHNSGKVISTHKRIPFVLVYYECCLNQADAIHREKYLKTTYGKRYIKQRIKNYLSDL